MYTKWLRIYIYIYIARERERERERDKETQRDKEKENEKKGGLRDVMVKAMNCGIVVSEYVLQSRYYVHFRANTIGKGMNRLILPAMG